MALGSPLLCAGSTLNRGVYNFPPRRYIAIRTHLQGGSSCLRMNMQVKIAVKSSPCTSPEKEFEAHRRSNVRIVEARGQS